LGSIQKPGRPQAAVLQDTLNGFCPEGVGVRLVGDLPRSGSKTCTCGVPDEASWLILLPVPGRSPTSQAPTPSAEAGLRFGSRFSSLNIQAACWRMRKVSHLVVD
jgi:hypothetical protein